MKENSPSALILLAVQEKLDAARAAHMGVELSAASAESSWLSMQEFDGFTKGKEVIKYSETEHKSVQKRYEQDRQFHLKKIKEWEEAFRVAIMTHWGDR